MKLKDKILVELQMCNYLSDRELTDRILGAGCPQQAVNSACRELCNAGYICRTARPIQNYIKDKKAVEGIPLTTQTHFDRPNYLEEEFNDFWNRFWGTEQDYYSQFTLEKLCELKMAITNINNLITYKSTLMAVELIGDILGFSKHDVQILHDELASISANRSGFDIVCRGCVPFVCEVKGNVPAGGKDFFGAEQKKQLDKDVKSLLYGKSSSEIDEDLLKRYYKFLAMYCNRETTLKAIHSYVANHKENVTLWNGQEVLEKDRVYIVLVRE